MSQLQQEILRETGGVVVLPSAGKLRPDQIQNASLTRWAWNPYRDINNMAPLGIYRQLGYGGTRYQKIEQGNVYPLGNITWNVDNIEEIVDNKNQTGPTPQRPFTLYALDQANELTVAYGEDHGLRVLHSFTGIDDGEVINSIFRVVQPRRFKVHEMEAEFGPKAKARIEDCDLKPDERAKAEALRVLFLEGSRSALKEAKREYQELITMMGKASVGQPGIATPTEGHEWLCNQLGVPTPSPIDKSPRQQTELSGAINILAERALREETTAELMESQLAAEREARARDREEFEARFAAIEGKKSAKKETANA